jgi:uncharacterized membrane protein
MLRFCNNTSEEVWVAYMFYSPEDCGGEGHDWQKIGWFAIMPGACSVVYANDLDDVNNRFWYFHAENLDLTVNWSGPISVHVTDEAFNNCLGIATTAERVVGFREIDVGDNDDFTVNLVL